MNHLRMILWTLFAMGIVAGCDDTESDGGDGQGIDDTDSDTGADTDTMPPTPYDDIDCSGMGLNETACEYWLCQNKEFYLADLTGCALGTAVCDARLACYEDFLACMRTACPVGTEAPADHDGRSEAGFYLCDNEQSTCMLYAQEAR